MNRPESLDCLNKKRVKVLKALKRRELDCGEIAYATDLSRDSVYYALQILLQFNLVRKKEAKKRTTWGRARSKHKEVLRYDLSPEGKEALEYLGLFEEEK